MRPWILLLSLCGACRVAASDPPSAVVDHRRADYASAEWLEPPPEIAALFASFADGAGDVPNTMGVVRLDERLSLVAGRLTSEASAVYSRDRVTELAQQAGSPLVPIAATMITVDGDDDRWATQLASGLEGHGPLAVGIASVPAAPDTYVLVFARSLFRLGEPVARAGAEHVVFALDERAFDLTPSLLVVDAAGAERIPAKPHGPGRWIAGRPGGFDRAIVAILGTTATTRPSNDRTLDSSQVLGCLRFDGSDELLVTDAASLDAATAELRTRWQRPALVSGTEPAPPCDQLASTIAGRPVTMRQQCISWPSTGSDAERWLGLRHSPLALEAIASERWQLVHWRRDPQWTIVRVARAFEDLTVAQARDRLTAALLARWPGLRHDAAADAATSVLAEDWAAGTRSAEADAAVADLTAQMAAKWTRTPRYFRLTWSDQDLAGAFDLLQPDATPGDYTLGVARGVGAEGEPRYFVVLYLSLPAAP